ncbi:GNAT family N-acetyltransferase [Acutalibacter caecimuris]|uniref:GNAT family N-acetyltransferase n=1 Tax=Acutalibacter caecimuris TaxID=3093657 RepID=UPI002AC8AA0B|nr:GNAT family N-acetyltransferase [Acutalibacter sp. M00118]
MEVIRVTPGGQEWPALIQYAETCGWEAGAHLAAIMGQNQFAHPWESVFAAVGEGAFLGFCTLLETDYYPENRYTPWISTVFVQKSHRGRRISGALIQKAADYARDQGFPTVYIPAGQQGLYEKYGFVEIDELENYGGGVDHIFAKPTGAAGENEGRLGAGEG